MARLVHFEITGHDSAALARFYAEQFGFRVSQSPFAADYHLLDAGGNGLSGAVMGRGYKSQPAILWFEVEDIERRLAAIIAAGGASAGERHTLPGQGHVQYATDPQGNVIGLKQAL
jgi:predicted enzyme related to lactoylglutathione lyase